MIRDGRQGVGMVVRVDGESMCDKEVVESHEYEA